MPSPRALHELTAAEGARLIRAGEVSPTELVQALLLRAGAVDGDLHAWETLDGERALATARDAEQTLRRDPSRIGPLHGVPFGVKDIFDTAGIRTAVGFPPYDERVPIADAEAVVRLKRAGAIVLGKTVTTQFAFTDPPRTRNPWSSTRTPGGSSSGSGVAVAAREAPAALGSQTAGSVLRPAAFNGVVGLKPTHGRISKRGVHPLAWSLDHVGVLARTVEDCALLLQTLAGHDPRDPSSADRAVSDYNLPAEPRAPRIGVLRAAVDRAGPEMRTHVQGVVHQLGEAGATVHTVELGEPLDLVLAVHHVTMATEAAAVHWQLLEQYPGAHQARIGAVAEAGRLISGATYVHAQRLRGRIRAAFARALRDVDALLLPTTSDAAPDLETTGDPSMQIPASLVGAPAISLPSGLSAERLPLAIQLIGAWWDEPRLLACARWCELRLERLPSPRP